VKHKAKQIKILMQKQQRLKRDIYLTNFKSGDKGKKMTKRQMEQDVDKMHELQMKMGMMKANDVRSESEDSAEYLDRAPEELKSYRSSEERQKDSKLRSSNQSKKSVSFELDDEYTFR
jgi:hypothetical protein